ncbi:hypothetical protein TCSYLVIO_010757, partial [Trypanosoma cruzi]
MLSIASFFPFSPLSKSGRVFQRHQQTEHIFENCFFFSFWTTEQQRVDPYICIRGFFHSPLDAPFNSTELLAALRNTPYGKAPGLDEVYSEALRHISSKGLRFLLRCINHSWTTGTIPVEWRRATIVPLLKPGNLPELLESYRPISLTSIVSKVAEKMVLKRLLWVWTPHPHQYAYRSMRTTTMRLAHLIHEVEHNRNHYFQVS